MNRVFKWCMRKVVIVMSLCLSLFSVSGCSLFESPDTIYYTQEYELNGKRYEYIEHDSNIPRSGWLFGEPRYSTPSIGSSLGRRTYIGLSFREGSGLLIRGAQLNSDTTFFVAGKKYADKNSFLRFVEDGASSKTLDLVYWLEEGKGDISLSVCFECTKKWTRDTIYCKNGRIDIYKRLPINDYWNKDFLRTE